MARAFGRLPYELRDEPFEWVLWTFQQLRDVEEMEAIVAESERVNAASLLSIATWSPPGLRSEERRVQARARAFSAAPSAPAMSVDEAREWMQRQMERVAAAGIFADPGTEPVVQ